MYKTIGILYTLFSSVLFYGLSSCNTCCAQVGSPYIKNFSVYDYSGKNWLASPQNWAITQDTYGVIYVANSTGIINYDGQGWSVVQGTENKFIDGLVRGTDGRIYTGITGDFGYLEPDSKGKMVYVSVLDQVNPEDRDFDRVWKVISTGIGVFFITEKKLFRFFDNKVKVWRAETQFLNAFTVNNRVFVSQKDVGLMELINEELYIAFEKDKCSDIINLLVPYGDQNDIDTFLIGTNTGLYLWSDNWIKNIETEADELLDGTKLNCGIRLTDGNYVLGTDNAGLLIMNGKGKIVNVINKQNGLQNECILSLFVDNQNTLWAGLEVGISYIEIPAQISYFDDADGLQGIILDIFKKNGILYVATTQGVYYLDAENFINKLVKFKIVKGLENKTCWNFLSANQYLLVASSHGIYQLSNTKAKIIHHCNSRVLYQSKQDPSRIYVGLKTGIMSLYLQGNNWINEGYINGHTKEVRSISETANGDLWISDQQVYKLKFPDGFSHDPIIYEYGARDGLPENSIRTYVYKIKGNTHFATSNGLYYFDEQSQQFYPDSTFGNAFATVDFEPIPLVEDQDGNIWLQSNGDVGMLKRNPTGGLDWDTAASLRIPKTNIWCLFPEENGIAWYGTDNGLIRYDGKVMKDYNRSYAAYIRKVTIEDDSVIFYGNYYNEVVLDNRDSISHRYIALSQPESFNPVLLYKHNSIAFEYTATYYDNVSANKFRYFLEGYDQDWSSWSSSAFKEYTNLSEGTYKFHVLCKNVYGQIGNEAIYEFRILPPWYRESWAFAGYGILLIALLLAVIHVRERRLHAEKRYLEAQVAERTEEVQKLSLAVNKAENAIIIADTNGKVEWANEGFTRLTGYKPEEIIGTSGEILRGGEPTGLSKKSEIFNRILKEKKPVTYEVMNHTKAGKPYWVFSTLTPIQNEQGEIEKIVAIDTDISDKKHTEEELKAAKERAEKSEKTKEQFLANMSHEIRTPMNAIIGFAKLVSKTNLTTEQSDFIKNIKISGDHLLVIINDILDYYKIESGQVSFERVDFSLKSVIDSVLDLHLQRADEANTSLHYYPDESLPEVFIGDPARLRQILINLVTNAIKFTEKGKVSITTTLKKKTKKEITIAFSVQDTGIGIPSDKLKTIFHRFAQASEDTTRKYGGSGLGLTIVKKLVELQGGDISVESQEGIGSSFNFTLTLVESNKTLAEIESVGDDQIVTSELGELNVLLVEDNMMNQKLAKKVLNDFGFNVSVADNGKIAIEMVKKQDRFDLILMDIQMPEMDGYQSTHYLRNKLDQPKCDIPVIAMTAHVTNGIIKNCKKAGMNDYIAKPFEPGDLYNRIARLIEMKDRNDKTNIEKKLMISNSKKGASLPKPPSDSDETYTDLSYLRNLAAGSNEFMKEMISDFIKKTPQEIILLHEHLETKNWKRLRAVAHKMKPTFDFMGIRALKETVSSVEKYAGEEVNLTHIPGLIHKMDNVCGIAIKELEKELETIKAS